MTSEGLLTLKIATLTLVSTAVIFDFIFAVRAMKLGIIALTVGSFVNCGVLALTVGKLKVDAVLCRIQYQKALVVVSVFGNKVELVAPAVLEDLLQLL